jgi:hypothetical protein
LEDDLSVCSEQEREIHRQFLVEQAKEVIGAWVPVEATAPKADSIDYRSPLIASLRAEREAERASSRQLMQESAASWRDQLSPCIRERRRIAETDTERNQELIDKRNAAFTEARRRELARFSTGTFPARSPVLAEMVKNSEWKKIYQSEMDRLSAARQTCIQMFARDLQPLGYEPSQKLSTRTWHVFVRPFQKNWQLRFGFAVSEMSINLHLYFCHRLLPKNINRGFGPLHHVKQHFEIRFLDSSPEFKWTYCKFQDVTELEVSQKAISYLYQQLHDLIVDVLERSAPELN